MAHIELMALGQDLGDAAAMAHLPAGRVTHMQLGTASASA